MLCVPVACGSHTRLSPRLRVSGERQINGIKSTGTVRRGLGQAGPAWPEQGRAGTGAARLPPGRRDAFGDLGSVS